MNRLDAPTRCGRARWAPKLGRAAPFVRDERMCEFVREEEENKREEEGRDERNVGLNARPGAANRTKSPTGINILRLNDSRTIMSTSNLNDVTGLGEEEDVST